MRFITLGLLYINGMNASIAPDAAASNELKARIRSDVEAVRNGLVSELEDENFLSKVGFSTNWEGYVRRIREYHEIYEVADDIDQLGEDGKTLLMRSVGDYEFSSQLLEYGADITIEDANGCNALCHAVKNGQYETVDLLVGEAKSRGMFDYINMGTIRPITAANHVQSKIDYLVERGAQPPPAVIRANIIADAEKYGAKILSDDKKVDGLPALDGIVIHMDSYIDIMKVADDIDQCGEDGKTLLMRSVESRSGMKTALLLLNFGASITKEDIHGCNALCHAVMKGQLRTGDFILDAAKKRGIDDYINMGTKRPITAAARDDSMIDYLVKRGATPPGHVIREKISAVMKSLDVEVDPNHEGVPDNLPDFLADIWKVADDIDQIGEDGKTLLMRSSEWANGLATAGFLLKFGASITKEDIHGCNALCYAVRSDQLEAAEYILDAAKERGIANYINMGTILPITAAGHVDWKIDFLVRRGAKSIEV